MPNLLINIVKDRVIELSIKNDILPSPIIALALSITDNGTSREYLKANNIFMIPSDLSNMVKCYSEDSDTIYESIEECKETAPVLYAVYTDSKDSVNEFYEYLNTYKRSKNGPYKYDNLKGEYDYKNFIYKLLRNGFVSDYLHISDESIIMNSLISIIEENKLYELDNSFIEEIKSIKNKKKKHDKDFTNIENPEHIYRVRLEWDKRDTQIFSSPNFDDALKEAKKHEGYKIFIDDDGELYYDPWVKEEEIPEEKEDNIPSVYKDTGIHKMINPVQNKKIILDNTPIYKNALTKYPFATASGVFYFYDHQIINHRVRVVQDKVNPKEDFDPDKIFGYISNIIY